MEAVFPTYYVVNRKLPRDEAIAVINALRITPCICAIISSVHDATLAVSLSANVIRTNSDADAQGIAVLIAKESDRPVLVIGEAEFLDAVWSDGRREKVAYD